MTVQRVLVVTAHPDDVDFAAGGTIAGFTDAGIEVSYCIATDGDAGEIRAPCDDCTVLMPAREPIVGREAVYLTRPIRVSA